MPPSEREWRSPILLHMNFIPFAETQLKMTYKIQRAGRSWRSGTESWVNVVLVANNPSLLTVTRIIVRVAHSLHPLPNPDLPTGLLPFESSIPIGALPSPISYSTLKRFTEGISIGTIAVWRVGARKGIIRTRNESSSAVSPDKSGGCGIVRVIRQGDVSGKDGRNGWATFVLDSGDEKGEGAGSEC